MSINPVLGRDATAGNELFPLPLPNEVFVLKRDGIIFNGQSSDNNRIVFLRDGDPAKHKNFSSVELPLHLLSGETRNDAPAFKQPFFSANYLEGKVEPVSLGIYLAEAAPHPLMGTTKWKLTFNKGGCQTFLRAFYRLHKAAVQNPGSAALDPAFAAQMNLAPQELEAYSLNRQEEAYAVLQCLWGEMPFRMHCEKSNIGYSNCEMGSEGASTASSKRRLNRSSSFSTAGSATGVSKSNRSRRSTGYFSVSSTNRTPSSKASSAGSVYETCACSFCKLKAAFFDPTDPSVIYVTQPVPDGQQGAYPPGYPVSGPPVAGPPGYYPPQQGGYPPQQGGYPPQQGGYPPQQGGYPPQQGGYPPQQGGYPPQQGGYPPQQGAYPPQQGYPDTGIPGEMPPQPAHWGPQNPGNGYPPVPNSGYYPPVGQGETGPFQGNPQHTGQTLFQPYQGGGAYNVPYNGAPTGH